MTFEELDETLPNGFHDAKIVRVAIDYAERSAILIMQLLVGMPDSADPEEYRKATVKITGLCYYSIEPPDPNYPFLRGGTPIGVAGYPEDSAAFAALNALLSVMPKGVDCYRFFVHDWNSFIHVAAEEVHFEWVDGAA